MQAEQMVEKKERRTFSEHLRVIFAGLLNWAAGILLKMGVYPNQLTTLGVVGSFVGAIFVAYGRFTVGGIIMLSMAIFDALDGTLARLRGEPEDFGAFVDSVADRYIELITFGSLLYYYALANDMRAVMLVFAAAAGSVLVSYVRARAQSLGFEAKNGILTRVERILVLGPSIIFGYPLVGITIVAVFANITAIQRIVHVRRTSREKN
jgi:CDP-diacylglycerol--glycerol-3-phosphate 3-phosphatidyltransferase